MNPILPRHSCRRCAWWRPSSAPSGRSPLLPARCRQRDPSSALPPVDGVPGELRQSVTLDWTGPVEALAADELARRVGVSLRGSRPSAGAAADRFRSRRDAQPLIAVLRDAGLRAGSAAMLTVDAAGRTVLLDWTEQPALAPERDR